eukprot:TRINITY_DN5427_c0_g7_i1.p1 TRINITY_DN5427_c0_g7~~TRINITY_DN5427_c0_g7_i1.p1  ORF type:complete len:1364 (-),score=277.05 TRINITY_DN5427_c0_g7_i1:83-3754(-)
MAQAAKDNKHGFRIDKKLCGVREYIPNCDYNSAPSNLPPTADVKFEIQAFLARHEAGQGLRSALTQVNPSVAVRLIRSLEAENNFVYSEKIVLAELQKVAKNWLTPDVERRLKDHVQAMHFTACDKERLISALLGQRQGEVEYLLDQLRLDYFRFELERSADPTACALRHVRKFRRQQANVEIRDFCQNYGFDDTVQMQLRELTAERGRRLMSGWNSQARNAHADFLVLLSTALKEHQRFLGERNMRESCAVASHARIILDWSEDEDDDDEEEDDLTSANAAARDRRTSEEAGERIFSSAQGDRDGSGNSSLEDSKRSRPAGSAAPAVQHFQIHSESSSATGSKMSGSQTALKQRKMQAKPTHFILCVDTSGSMSNRDCPDSRGWTSTRLQAVLDTCRMFIAGSRLHVEDVYSFVTFNEEAKLHLACLGSMEAEARLNDLDLVAEKQTLYSMGIRGIYAAIQHDTKKLPAHVIFLSDGEPTDPESYLTDFAKLRKKYSRDELRIFTIGFGQSAKVNAKEGDFAYLQQLASLGNGHFQRCGANLESLSGAFTALSSTISHMRSSTKRSTSDVAHGSSSAAAAAPAGTSSSPATTASAAAAASSTAEAEDSHEREAATSSGMSSKLGFAGAPAAASRGPIHFDLATLQEADEDVYEVSSDEAPQDETGADGGGGGASGKPARDKTDFEIPDPLEIFKDVGNKELWHSWNATKTNVKFDGRFFVKSSSAVRVNVRRKPFIKGGMRLVYGLLDEKGAAGHDPTEHMCAKRRLNETKKKGVDSYHENIAFCRSTAVAFHYAKEFRAALRKRINRVMEFGFLPCDVYSPVDQYENAYHFCGEKWLKGHFVKLNSNAGFVNEHEYKEHSAVAQAFSHFTFDRSHGQLIVVDLQGVCGGEDGGGENIYFVLTDPQVHSRGSYERFGPGDLGDQGVQAFFRAHTCNEWCRRLGLRRVDQICDPSVVVKIPNFRPCFTWLKGAQNRTFLQKVGKACRATEIIVPQEEIHGSDWHAIKIWATRKGSAKAEELLQEQLELFYADARAKETVPAAVTWPSTRWEQQLLDWETQSGARVCAWPPDWREKSDGVRELWVFERHEKHKHSDALAVVCKRIRDALAMAEKQAQANATAATGSGNPGIGAAGAADPSADASGASTNAAGARGSSLAAASASAASTWTKYQDPHGKKYWYREPDGLWFYEADRNWQRFVDETGERYWWWHNDTGTWFFEPSR